MPDASPQPTSTSSHSPFGLCPKCRYPIDPGMCPECGTVTTDPNLLLKVMTTKERHRQIIRWLRRAALLALIPVASAILIALSVIAITAVLGREAKGWTETSDAGRVYGLIMLVMQLIGTPFLIFSLAALAFIRDDHIPKQDRLAFTLTTLILSAIGWVAGIVVVFVTWLA